jgi:hypothetical protein
MTRNLVLTIMGCILLAFGLAMICQLAFPDILPHAAGEEDASSWRWPIAFFTTATAWLSVELAGIFAIMLVACLWNRLTRNSPARIGNP